MPSGTERLKKIEELQRQIAAELGTSREVVSRILADFSDDGLINSGRGYIVVQDMNRLRQRGEAPPLP